MTELLDAGLLKDLRGLVFFFFRHSMETMQSSRFSLQLQNPHQPRQSYFSRADGQMRSRAESDLPDSSESAWRFTSEMLHEDVLFTVLDNERQSCPIQRGTQRS